jgi:gliding motility-associated-like protein
MSFVSHQLLFSTIMTILLLVFSAGRSSAQLTVSGAMTPAQLVQNVLLGPGVTVMNITYNGAPAATGSFNGAASNIGLANGMLLTCGNISNAPGPNNLTGASTSNNLPGDPDLDGIMAPTLSYDATILEFDFIPTGDSVKFRYVFASEEYMEYVSSTPGGINDGFGFFLSGVTTPMPVTNIAVLPNSTTPITMFNVNCMNLSPYYICNDPQNMICSSSYNCPTSQAGTTVQYDGFTTVLTARAAVICGETYHIKIAIADGGDWILDSGVFLEGGSFASASTVQMSSTVNFGGNDTTMYEGCSMATIVFDRGAANLSSADTLYYTISGTAVNGTDYSFIPDSVYFPPGIDTAFITLNALVDALTNEGIETLTITATYINPCTGDTATNSITLYIQDTPPLTVTASADTFIVCPGEVIPISAQAAGGVGIGGYTYSWAPGGGTAPGINVSPGSTTTYTVSATDSCGVIFATDQVTVTVLPYTYPQVLVGDQTICTGDSIDLVAAVMGGLPQYSYQWSALGNDSVLSVAPATTSSYTVVVSDYCNNTDTTSATVTVTSVTAAFSYVHETNSIVNFFDQSSANVVSWHWLFDEIVDGDPAESWQENPIYTYNDTGVFAVQLIVTTASGCSDTAVDYITVLPDMYFYFPSAFTPNGDGINDYFTGYGLGIEKYNMMIFNRWGGLIYETDDMTKGWDGRTKSGPVEQEVYVAVFNLEGDVDGVYKKVKYIGRVTLIR